MTKPKRKRISGFDVVMESPCPRCGVAKGKQCIDMSIRWRGAHPALVPRLYYRPHAERRLTALQARA